MNARTDAGLAARFPARSGGISEMGRWINRLTEVNKELWLLLSLLGIAALMNSVVASHRMVLGFYTMPTLFSAYYYGRRHATLTAFGSAFIVVLVVYFKPPFLAGADAATQMENMWFDIAAWAGTLVLTGYAMGTLSERDKRHLAELRETYHGVLLILRQFISKDNYTQNHSYRVSVYAARIASYMGLNQDRIEDVRAAAMLHDIGKLDISREILYKAARLTHDEYEEMKSHVARGMDMLQPVGGSLRRILPIILAHHDRFDGTGYHPTEGDQIPIEARIIAVADSYDAITADRPYRRGSSPLEAKDIIEKKAGKDFDPKVVDAFLSAFRKGEMDIPEVVI